MTDAQLLLALETMFSRVEERPLKLSIAVSDAQEVIALRAEVTALRGQLQELQARFNHVEFLYCCESVVNQRLLDLCRDAGVRVPRSLFQRPDSASG